MILTSQLNPENKITATGALVVPVHNYLQVRRITKNRQKIIKTLTLYNYKDTNTVQV
jgi:hypothetical protein